MTEIEKPPINAATGDVSETGSEEKPRKKLGLCGGCTLALLGLVVVGGFFLLWWTSRINHASGEFCGQIESELQDAEARLPVVEPDEDAGPLYAQAWGLFVASGDPKNLSGLTNMFKAKPGTLAKFVTDNVAYRKALKKAVARPKYGAQVDFREGFWANVSDIQQFREAVRHLTVVARYEARRGNTGETIALLIVALRISRHAGANKLHISRMVQIACEGITVNALEYILNDADIPEKELHTLLGELDEQLRSRLPMHEVFRRNRLLTMAMVKDLVDGKKNPYAVMGVTPNAGAKLVFGAWRASGLTLKNGRNVRRYLEECEAAARKPIPRAIDDMKKLDDRAAVRASGTMAQFKRSVNGLDLNDWFTGSGSRLMISEGRGLAKLRLARLALGCRLYKLKTGKYPTKLSDLTKAFPKEFGKLPADPFTGKDMKYAPTKTGCKIWSINADRVDQGGLKRGKNNRNACDIVFELTK